MRRDKEAEKDQAIQEAAGLIKEALSLLKEFIRVGISNPVMGVTAAMIMGDMAKRTGLIDSGTYDGILVAIGVLEAGAVASEFASFLPFHNSGSDLNPSVSSVVFADNNNQVRAALVGDKAAQGK